MLFGVPSYPSFKTIFERIRSSGLRHRVNLVLAEGRVDHAPKLEHFVRKAVEYGAERVCCWQERGEDDKTLRKIGDESMAEMAKLSEILPVCVYYPPRECGDKVCLFPDGEVRDTWCR